MPTLTRPSGNIRYNVHGDGPVLLLSHGYGATSAMFDQNLAALWSGNRVITWDLRGHGGSDSPADPASYSAGKAVADMAAILDELGVDRAILGGHSLGGYLSLDFTLAHPERVAALVLIDTGPGFRKDEARDGWNQRAEGTASRLAERGLAALGSGAELGANGHQDVSGLILAARGTLTQSDGHVMAGLPGIAVPTLVIVGADDKNFLAAADYMATRIPGARKVVIPDAGHAPNVEQPEAFNAEVVAFLASVPS